MESSTESKKTQDEGTAGDSGELVAAESWEQFLQRLPAGYDLEASAQKTKALLRRREVKSAGDLLRLVFAYAVCDWSLRLVGAWSTLIGVGALSDVAVLKRLRGCRIWLGSLIATILKERRVGLVRKPGVRLRIMDGTVVSRPGSTGTDWRLHLSLDLGNLCLDGVEVSDAHTGENFVHCPTQPGDIRLGDRGYGYANSMGPVLAAGGWLVVRISWQNPVLEDQAGQQIDIPRLLKAMKNQSLKEQPVFLPTQQGRFGLRLLIAALPQEAADKARHRLRQRKQKKGKTPDQRTLLAAGFTILLTNLPAKDWPSKQVFHLYRLRWQIELFIKRLKSILHCNQLRAQDPQLTQVYLLGKILAALLLDDCLQQVKGRCPAWFRSVQRPPSMWRLTSLFFEGLLNSVRGTITLEMVLVALPRLQRYLCAAPRKRTQQLAQARSIFSSLSGCQ
jgi:hypothetical protein